jgi:hypothetical protein
MVQGYPVHPEVGQTWDNCTTVVVELPVKAPKGRTKYDVSAIEQLEIYKMFMEEYVDHNASITISVREHEWEAVEQWMFDNWDSCIGLSFLSLDDHYYQLMPFESITKAEYEKRVVNMKEFNPDLLNEFERLSEQEEHEVDNSECTSGACPIR